MKKLFPLFFTLMLLNFAHGQIDMTPLTLNAPISPLCSSDPLISAMTVTVKVKNVAAASIDFSVNPLTVTVNITGPIPQSFFTTVSSGTLATNATMPVSVTASADFSAVGSHSVLYTTSVAGDADASNDSQTEIIVVQAPVTVATAGPAQTNCNSGNFTLAGNAPTVGSGLWTVFSGTATISSPSSPTSAVTGVPVGTSAVLTWNITNGSCTSSSTVTLTNNSPATVSNAGTDQSNCNSGSFTLAGNTAIVGVGVWSVLSGTAVIAVPTSEVSAVTSVPAGTSAVLTWTITNGSCSASSSTVTLTNDISVTVASAGPAQTNCNSGNFTLAGNTAIVGVGVWTVFSGTATISSPLSTTSAVSGVPVGTSAVLTWNITNGSCTSSSTVTLTNDLPATVSSAGAAQTNCNSGTFTLAGNTPTIGVGLWSVVSGPATVAIANTLSPTSTVTGVTAGTSAVLKWTITNGSCPASSSTVTLTNDFPATVSNAGAAQTNCNSGTFTLAGNVPAVNTGSGLWTVVSGTATIASPLSATSAVSGVPVGTSAVLTWNITNGSCTSSSTVTLTNNSSATVSNAGPAQSNCNSGNFTLAGNTPSVGTGLWTVFSGTATIAIPSSPTSAVTGVPVGTSAVLIWIITDGSCPTSSSSVTLTNDLPATVSNAGPAQTNCNSGTFTLAGNTPSVGSGLWSVLSGTATIASPTSEVSAVTGVPVGTSAVLSWNISNGSCISSSTVILTNDNPVTVSNAGTAQTNCNSGTFTLAGNTPTIGVGLWTVFSGTVTIASPSSPTSAVSGVPVGTSAVLTWNITNGSCTSSSTVTLTNDSQVAPTITASGSTSFCQGDSVILSSSSAIGNIWSNGAITQSITITIGGSYTVAVSNGTCSSPSLPTIVTINSLSSVILTPINSYIDVNAIPIQLSGTPSGGTFSGLGVVGSLFYPVTAGLGAITITYSYSNAACSNTANQSVIVYDTTGSTCTTLTIPTPIVGLSSPNNINTITVYPNPTNTNITIDFGNFLIMNGYSIKIINSLGQQVYTCSINQQSSNISLATLSGTGIYYLSIIDPQSNTVAVRKIVLQ